MKRLWFILVFGFAACSQQYSVVLSPEEDARRIVELSGMEDVMIISLREMDELMMANVQRAARQQGKELSDEAATYFVELLLEETADRMAREMRSGVVELYVENYSAETLRSYRKFLESPAGEEVAAKQLELTSASFAIGDKIGEEAGMLAGPKIAEDIQRDVWGVEGSEAAKSELRNFFGITSSEDQPSEQ